MGLPAGHAALATIGREWKQRFARSGRLAARRGPSLPGEGAGGVFVFWNFMESSEAKEKKRKGIGQRSEAEARIHGLY